MKLSVLWALCILLVVGGFTSCVVQSAPSAPAPIDQAAAICARSGDCVVMTLRDFAALREAIEEVGAENRQCTKGI